MKRCVVALILAMCAVAGVLTYLNDKATNGGLPLVHAAAPTKSPAFNLLTLCPTRGRNIPILPERTA